MNLFIRFLNRVAYDSGYQPATELEEGERLGKVPSYNFILQLLEMFIQLLNQGDGRQGRVVYVPPRHPDSGGEHPHRLRRPLLPRAGLHDPADGDGGRGQGRPEGDAVGGAEGDQRVDHGEREGVVG